MKNISFKATWSVPDEKVNPGKEVRNHVLGFFNRNLVLSGQTYELISILNEMLSLTLSLDFYCINIGMRMANPLLGIRILFEWVNEPFKYDIPMPNPNEVVEYYSCMRSARGETSMHSWFERITYIIKNLSGATLTGVKTGTKIEIPKFDTPTELRMKLQLATGRTRKT